MTYPIGLAAQAIRHLSPTGVVEVAAAAGFGCVGVPIDPAGWTAADTRGVKAALAASGLIAMDAEVIRIQDRAVPEFERLLDIAGEVGARHVIVVSFASDLSATQAALHLIGDYARRVGVRPVLEFGAFTRVPDAATALPLALAAGIGILADPLHLARGGGTAADLRSLPPELLPYAQLCDAGPAVAGADAAALLDEAREHRLQIGEGVLDLAGFVAALPPGTPLMNEVRSIALETRYPDPLDRAKALAAAMRTLLAGQENAA